jgi:hypothetical protein
VPRLFFSLLNTLLDQSTQGGSQNRELPLALFVLRVCADHHDATSPPNNAALVAHFADRCTNFHKLQLQTLYFTIIFNNIEIAIKP